MGQQLVKYENEDKNTEKENSKSVNKIPAEKDENQTEFRKTNSNSSIQEKEKEKEMEKSNTKIKGEKDEFVSKSDNWSRNSYSNFINKNSLPPSSDTIDMAIDEKISTMGKNKINDNNNNNNNNTAKNNTTDIPTTEITRNSYSNFITKNSSSAAENLQNQNLSKSVGNLPQKNPGTFSLTSTEEIESPPQNNESGWKIGKDEEDDGGNTPRDISRKLESLKSNFNSPTHSTDGDLRARTSQSNSDGSQNTKNEKSNFNSNLNERNLSDKRDKEKDKDMDRRSENNDNASVTSETKKKGINRTPFSLSVYPILFLSRK
jgi:hypothetical protein